jgi:hypothetical protein
MGHASNGLDVLAGATGPQQSVDGIGIQPISLCLLEELQFPTIVQGHSILALHFSLGLDKGINCSRLAKAHSQIPHVRAKSLLQLRREFIHP